MHGARPVGRRAHVRSGALVREPVLHARVDRGPHRVRTLGAELARHRERGELGPVAHLVREHPAEPGDRVLVAQEPVQSHVVRREALGELLVGELQRLRTEPVERRPADRGRCHAPHPGAAFLARLGEQQRRPLVEHEPGLSVARLGGLLVVDQQPAALHQVDHEHHRLEAQQQVLATAADLDERMAVRLVRSRHGGLQRGEVERHEPLQGAPAELLGEPLGVRLHLGELGHRGSSVSGTRCGRGPWRTRRRVLGTRAATRSASAGRRRARCGRR
ncbi:unannotated protein [freshwater metagenome]|uniref:Unannotated protein n=1 Tax=freshwater metagenome TaxID=449393 RepID=A0A6J6DBK5_9ZZZZ